MQDQTYLLYSILRLTNKIHDLRIYGPVSHLSIHATHLQLSLFTNMLKHRKLAMTYRTRPDKIKHESDD